MDKRYFSDKIVKWYLENKRDLPWRATRDPYKIWLSEVILQQTRVSQGLPYYQAFVKNYPAVTDLANASETQVLRMWQGLGYYTRARNLHACAKHVAKVLAGKFPNNFDSLKKLPGVGEYTAAAIASFAYKESVAVVDGNVFRVLARIFGIETAINSNEGKKSFGALANSLIDPARPDVHNQAVMEFGATWCTPKLPKCSSCPFEKQCVARIHNMQDILPVKLKNKKSRKRYFYYIVIENKKKLLMKKRVDNDIWKGLYDFHLIEKTKMTDPKKIALENDAQSLLNDAELVSVSKTYKHLLTHQTIFTRFLVYKSNGDAKRAKNTATYTLTQIGKLPKPVLVSRFLSDHYSSELG